MDSKNHDSLISSVVKATSGFGIEDYPSQDGRRMTSLIPQEPFRTVSAVRWWLNPEFNKELDSSRLKFFYKEELR